MPVVLSKNRTTTTTITEHMKLREHSKPISETTKKQNQSSKISSLLISSLSPNNTNETKKPTSSNSQKKKKNTNFASTTLRNLGGCTAAEKVAVPEALVMSKSKRKIQNKVKINDFEVQNESFSRKNAMVDGSVCGNSVADDVWCEPRIGFSAHDERVLATKRNLGGNGRVKISQRERPCSVRRTVNPQTISFIDSDTAFVTTYTEQEVFGTKYYPRTRHSSPEDDAEIMMLRRGHIRGNRLDMPDRYSAWRLDVDHMSYEELLELGERIGYVNTGLKEDEISRCLRKFKLSKLYALSHNLPLQMDRKCSICQEEYEADDEIGKLNCGHGYHIQCIKQWLAQKNACPVCKNAPVAR